MTRLFLLALTLTFSLGITGCSSSSDAPKEEAQNAEATKAYKGPGKPKRGAPASGMGSPQAK